MTDIAGAVGPIAPDTVERMLGGETAATPGATFGRKARPGRPGALHREGALFACAGHALGDDLDARLARDDFAGLDGAFAAARWDGTTLTLIRDPFGQRALFWTVVGGTFYFASELATLLAAPGVKVELDPIAVHKYLTFSFVPGEATPIAGVRRVAPGHVLTWRDGRVETRPWFVLEEHIAPVEQGAASKTLWRLALEAVGRRLRPGRAGLYLSGGIDSSAVGLWLKDAGADVTAFTLDFGAASVEREEAIEVARHLGLRHTLVPVQPAELGTHLDAIAGGLEMPFGDPVTGPHWLLGRAARAAGFDTVWNGEGGDQLFGGWTSKPMIAAAIYGGESETPAQQYLRSYHRFYGLEAELYAPALAAAVTPGERRATIARFLESDRAHTFLNRVRLTDISLKGSHNILPRAERMAAAHGLDLQMPLFDRRLAEWSFTLPTDLKLHGACEKYVLKLALQKRLPEAIVWRRKFGMSVPVTDWVLGPLRPVVETLLSDEAVRRRGLLRPEFVRALREGHDVAGETRRRRLGERLWALLMLEAWCRRFLDGRGRPA